MSLLLVIHPPVPSAEPIERRVAPDYERFDGLADTVLEGSPSLGDAYGPSPRPGQQQTHRGPQGGISGKVGSVGATPLPVADCVHKTDFGWVEAPLVTTQFRFGPGGANPGVGSTMAASDSMNPGQPSDFFSIFAGEK